MILLKKLIFAPFFLIVFSVLIYQINPLLDSYDFILSLSGNTFTSLLIAGAFISASSFLFILFAAVASDWKISLPTGLIASAITFIFIPPALALVFAVAIFISLLATHLYLDNALKNYLTFKPADIFGPPIKNLSRLLILSFCVIYFFSITTIIVQNGFQIPDSLIDTALKVSPMSLPEESSLIPAQLPSISQEEIELLKQNPSLLQERGLDPGILDTLNQPQPAKTSQNSTYNLIKQTVKDQVQNIIKPYLDFIPAVLTLLLFFILQSIISIINLFITPLLWLTFLILEKTGFVKFETEMREAKKLVV